MRGRAIRLPSGVRDFLPRAAARRRAIAEGLLQAFERWGYERIITPAFEYDDVLGRGLGADAHQAAIRFVEPATGDVVALRPDITPQVARLAATRYGDSDHPLRLCYEGAVLRLAHKARGQREIIQAGVELIGAGPPQGDAEVITLALDALRGRGDEPTLELGHVALLQEALRAVPDEERRAAVRQAVARKDVAGVAEEARGVPDHVRRLLVGLPTLYGPPAEVLARAQVLPLGPAGRAALAELQAVLELVAAAGQARLLLDLGEVRGFEYYTGVRFAGYVPGAGDAVVRGGRYDDLVARYGRQVRATGFALDVEAIAQAEKSRGVPAPEAPPAVLVAGPASAAYQVASALRALGLRVPLSLSPVASPLATLVAEAKAVGARGVLALGRAGGHGQWSSVTGEAAASVELPEAAITRAQAGDGRELARAVGLPIRIEERS